MQTLGASKRKRKDAVFPWDRPLPSAAWFSSFTSRPLWGEGDKPPAALSAGQLRGRGPWTDATRASKAAGEPSAGLMGGDRGVEGGSASSSEGPGGVVRSPQGVEEIRRTAWGLEVGPKSQEIISALDLEEGNRRNN